MLLYLSEVGDKLPNASGTLIHGCAIALIAFGFGRVHRGLVLLPMPIIFLLNWVMIRTLREHDLGAMIFDELGWSWIVDQFFGGNVPYAVAVVAAFKNRKV